MKQPQTFRYLYGFYLDRYKNYGQSISQPKFPRQLSTQEDMTARLAACFSLEIQLRGVKPDFDAPTVAVIKAAARWMFDAGHKGLILYGNHGNGKTTLLKAMSRVICSGRYNLTVHLAEEVDKLIDIVDNYKVHPKRE